MRRTLQQADLVVEQSSTQPESKEESQPYGDCACLLAATDKTDILESTPTVVFCPNCGETVETYEQGLPQIVSQFDTRCTTCDVELRRWCAVGVDAAYMGLVESPKLTEMTQAYWNKWLWSGITNYKGQPRNDEHAERLRQKASEFGWDWEVSCPLCRRDETELKEHVDNFRGSLDYHHWSTNPDQGITLCRECHDIIGFDSYDNQVEERASDWGFRSRNDLQVIRLALREAIATDQPFRPKIADQIVTRYNLIQSTEEVRELLSTVLRDSDYLDRFVDKSLSDGLENL